MSDEHNADDWTELTHAGERWSFDADQLAIWDEEEEYYEFYLNHELTNPTVDTVKQFIDETNARVALATSQREGKVDN